MFVSEPTLLEKELREMLNLFLIKVLIFALFAKEGRTSTSVGGDGDGTIVNLRKLHDHSLAFPTTNAMAGDEKDPIVRGI